MTTIQSGLSTARLETFNARWRTGSPTSLLGVDWLSKSHCIASGSTNQPTDGHRLRNWRTRSNAVTAILILVTGLTLPTLSGNLSSALRL